MSNLTKKFNELKSSTAKSARRNIGNAIGWAASFYGRFKMENIFENEVEKKFLAHALQSVKNMDGLVELARESMAVNDTQMMELLSSAIWMKTEGNYPGPEVTLVMRQLNGIA